MSPSPPAIRTLRSVAELRTAIGLARFARPMGAQGRHEVHQAGRSELVVGLVPTMGALHEGHLSLIRHAARRCDLVVVSLFVNPTQFNEADDLERYPRQEERDAELAGQAGAQLLFAPSRQEIYPEGFATFVEVKGLTEPLEGAWRGAEHFRGVSTVVCKLLNIVSPDIAFFGQKDAQQVLVINQMVRDLNMSVEIAVCPTVRENDGLARSSRNELLDPDERIKARALYAALSDVSERAAEGERASEALLALATERMADHELEAEYLALVNPGTLEPLESLDRDGLLLIAARVGSVRLIDNLLISPLPRAATVQPDQSTSRTPGKAESLCSA